MTDGRLAMVCDSLYDETREIDYHRPAHIMLADPTGSIADVVDVPAYDNLSKKGWAGNQLWYRLLGYNLTGKVKINGKGKKFQGKKADVQYEKLPFVEVSEAMMEDWQLACADEHMRFDREE